MDKLNLLSHITEQEYNASRWSLASILLPEEPGRFRPVYRGDASVFCIQLFCIDEKYEARQVLVSSRSVRVKITCEVGGPVL